MAKRKCKNKEDENEVNLFSRDDKKAEQFIPHKFKTKSILMRSDPKVLIASKAYALMWHIVNQSSEEVGWLGIVKEEGNDFVIEDILIFKQEVDMGTCEISPEGLAEVGMELVESHPEGVDVLNRLRMWGHSHVNMGTGGSGQDDSQMGVFEKSGCPYFIRGILNKKGKMEFNIYLYDRGLRIEDAEWCVFTPVDNELENTVKAELEEKVSKLVSTVGYGVHRNKAKGGRGNESPFGAKMPYAEATEFFNDPIFIGGEWEEGDPNNMNSLIGN